MIPKRAAKKMVYNAVADTIEGMGIQEFCYKLPEKAGDRLKLSQALSDLVKYLRQRASTMAETPRHAKKPKH